MKNNSGFFFIFCASLLCFASCTKDEDAINNILGIVSEAPVYTGYSVVSSKQIDFNFSSEVSVRSAYFEPEMKVKEIINGGTVSIIMDEEKLGGERFNADILVEDSNGNTLNILVPFRTLNDRVPDFLINEIRLDYSSSNGKYRSEFIELYTKSAGNLGAAQLYVVSTSDEEAVYEFPPVEVSAGEYITLHLRTTASDNGIDELGNDFSLAVGASSKTYNETPGDARDLWLPTNKKFLHKTDVIYFCDQKNRIIDAVVLCEKEQAWTKNKVFEKSAELLASQGQWLSKEGVAVKTPQAEDAVSSAKTTTTKTLCRDESAGDSNTSADWYICDSSKCSPGKENSPRP